MNKQDRISNIVRSWGAGPVRKQKDRPRRDALGGMYWREMEAQSAIPLYCERLGISKEALLGRDRHEPLATARKCAYWALVKRGCRVRAAAQMMGGRHHATIVTSAQDIEAEIELGSSPMTAAYIKAAREVFGITA